MLQSSVERDDLQPQVWAYLPVVSLSQPHSPVVGGAAPQEKGFPLDSPALPPLLHRWPWPAPWAPAREQTLAPLPSTEWEEQGCGRPSQEPQPGTGIQSERDAWGCGGARTKAQGPGPGAGLGGGAGGQGRNEGAPCSQLCQGVKVRSLAAAAGGGTHSLDPCSLLKGPEP